MNEYVFFFLREKSSREKKDEKRQLSKMSERQLSFLFCAVVLWTKPRGLGGCIHHFRDLGYVNYRKYKNVNYCLGFVLG
jgi:hypothetical protein